MPQVNNLVSDTPDTKPAAVALPSALPAFLASAMQNVPTEVEIFETCPYVGIAHNLSPKWDQQKAAGCAVGDIYVNAGGDFKKFMPLTYFALAVWAFGTKTSKDAKKKLLAATDDMDKTGYKKDFDEHFISVIVVDAPGIPLMPVKAEFAATQAKAGAIISRGLAQAMSADWPSLSPEHAASAAFPIPAGRVYFSTITNRGISKTNGNAYYTTPTTARPATAAQMKRLSDALSTPAFHQQLQEVSAACETRIAEIRKLINPAS